MSSKEFINFTDTFYFMSNSFDFDQFKVQAIEQLKAGVPLSGKDVVLAPLLENLLNSALEGEMDSHLEGGEREFGNRRNGHMSKQVQTSQGEVTVNTPRDRDGTFDPQVVRKRGNTHAGRGYTPNRIDIEERPSIVDLKQRFGDLEIDTVIGSNHKGALVTINDRLTSKVWIRKLSGKDAAPLALKTIEALQPVKDLIHTITADNGKEFAKHQEIAEKLEISFYFCKPYHSWERGANENKTYPKERTSVR